MDSKTWAVESFVKKTIAAFPGKIISADVYAGEGARKTLGQNGILNQVDAIIPMVYTYFGQFGGVDNAGIHTKQIISKYPKKSILPLVRGWRCIESKNSKEPGCGKTESQEEFEDNMKKSFILLRTLGLAGHGVFTYESFLDDVKNIYLNEMSGKLDF